MIRVYIAGSYSSNNILSILNNIRIGKRIAVEVMLAGFAPFCPFLDYQFHFMLREGEDLTIAHYQNYSIAWLEASHVMLVLPNSEDSKGTQVEIEKARELKIPIYYSLEDLIKYEKTTR